MTDKSPWFPCAVCARPPAIAKPHDTDKWEWVHLCQPEHPLGSRLLKEAYHFDRYEDALRNWYMFNLLSRELFRAQREGIPLRLGWLMECFREGGIASRVDCDSDPDRKYCFVVTVGGEQIGTGHSAVNVIKTWLKRLGGEDMAGWRMKFATSR